MNVLQSMRVFVSVVETGSFTGTAKVLSATTAYVSRAVSDLEHHLNARLLNRNTRKLALTEVGQRYLERCTYVLAEIDNAESEATEANVTPSGRLRIHAPTGLGQHYVIKAIRAYRRLYPDVRFHVTLGQRIPDLLEEGFDIALIAAEELSDSGLISRTIGSAYSIACASPEYINQFGSPKFPNDLTQHACIRLQTATFPSDAWTFNGPTGSETVKLPQSFLELNTTESLAEAVSEGLGIGLLPVYSAVRRIADGSLSWILPEYVTQEMTLHAVYPSRRYLDAKIRTWVEFLHERVPKMISADFAHLQLAIAD